ncbi:hypothetical protein Y032_0015g2550 [Ancylostoma ceylanicum]|nr:hypothetical protein Y032_0015g2550 [Ancylostoma ceylanicum]
MPRNTAIEATHKNASTADDDPSRCAAEISLTTTKADVMSRTFASDCTAIVIHDRKGRQLLDAQISFCSPFCALAARSALCCCMHTRLKNSCSNVP